MGRALTGSDDPLEVVERLDLDAVNVRPDYATRRSTSGRWSTSGASGGA